MNNLLTVILFLLNLTITLLLFFRLNVKLNRIIRGTFADIIDQARKDVEELITEINRVTDRNITIITDRISSVKKLIDEADRKILRLDKLLHTYSPPSPIIPSPEADISQSASNSSPQSITSKVQKSEKTEQQKTLKTDESTKRKPVKSSSEKEKRKKEPEKTKSRRKTKKNKPLIDLEEIKSEVEEVIASEPEISNKNKSREEKLVELIMNGATEEELIKMGYGKREIELSMFIAKMRGFK